MRATEQREELIVTVTITNNRSCWELGVIEEWDVLDKFGYSLPQQCLTANSPKSQLTPTN